MKLEKGENVVYFQAGGEWCYLWTPPSFDPVKPVPVLIHHHGAGGYVRDGASDWVDTESKAAYLRAAMEGSGCAVAGSHACGNHWGNKCAVKANEVLLNKLDSVEGLDTSRLGLMGGGLGGTLVWNSVLGPLAGRAKAVVVMQAVANLSATIREQKFKAPCLEAYGLPADTPDDDAIAVIFEDDPMPRLRNLEKGTPLPKTAIYHGLKDANIPAKTNAIPLAESLKKAGGDVDLVLFTEVEHNVYAMGKPIEDQLRKFFSIL